MSEKAVIELIEDIFSDTTVSRKTTKEILTGIKDHIEMLLETLED